MINKVKYKGFDLEYYFLLHNKERLTFCGEDIPLINFNPYGPTAYEYMFDLESNGIRYKDTCEPLLLRELRIAKGSINWHIKQWSEGISEDLFSKLEIHEHILTYKDPIPDWIFKSLENQIWKLRKINKCNQNS